MVATCHCSKTFWRSKQAMIILLEQHGRKRSEILASLNLPTNRQGLEQLASQSSVGEQLLAQSDALTALLTQCQTINVNNGQSILIQQAATANQLKILTGGEPPALYDARGSTSKLSEATPAQSGLNLSMSSLYQDAPHAGNMLAMRSHILSGE